MDSRTCLTRALATDTSRPAKALINHMTPLDALDTDVAALAKRICDKPAAAVRMGKSLFYRQLEAGMEAAYQMASQTIACNAIDPVAQEGMRAFIERRKPNWSE